jgi:hypothetical protein
MKVIVHNLLSAPQFVDVDGNKSTDDIVTIGPRVRETIELPNEKRFLELQREHKGKLNFRKAK